MSVPQSIEQRDTGRCDQNGLGLAETWMCVSPCGQALIDMTGDMTSGSNPLNIALAPLAGACTRPRFS
jgi:hypothetical protein